MLRCKKHSPTWEHRHIHGLLAPVLMISAQWEGFISLGCRIWANTKCQCLVKGALQYLEISYHKRLCLLTRIHRDRCAVCRVCGALQGTIKSISMTHNKVPSFTFWMVIDYYVLYFLYLFRFYNVFPNWIVIRSLLNLIQYKHINKLYTKFKCIEIYEGFRTSV